MKILNPLSVFLALPTKKFPQERVVVVEHEIYEIVYEHDINGHAVQDATTKAVLKTYYGITREEVYVLLRHCQICARKASSKSKGPLIPIISTSLFERVQIDLIDFSNTPDGDYKWVAHIKDHFSKISRCTLREIRKQHVLTLWPSG
jgi:hypothetical protein